MDSMDRVETSTLVQSSLSSCIHIGGTDQMDQKNKEEREGHRPGPAGRSAVSTTTSAATVQLVHGRKVPCVLGKPRANVGQDGSSLSIARSECGVILVTPAGSAASGANRSSRLPQDLTSPAAGIPN